MTETNKKDDKSSWSALSLAWELGYTVAVPLVALTLLGRLLDKKFGTAPFLLLIGILLSLVITSVGIVRKTTKIMKEMDNLSKREKL